LRLTLSMKLDGLVVEMQGLQQALSAKGVEFQDVIKMGRTQLQDAVPMTLGQEFEAWGVMVGEDILRVREAQALIREINLGATAIGTGINAPPGYAELVTAKLREISNVPVVKSHNLVEATQDAGAYVQLSGVLKRVAVKLSKISNDLRLLSSGPRAGLGEINLPPMAPGSSIMPGKVNPIIPEVVNQVAFEVIGNDLTVTMAAEAGQLELNAMEPVIAYSLFTSLDMLGRACRTLVERCILGITANREHCRQLVENSIGLVTALNPILGYEKASQIAEEALRTGKPVVEVVLEHGYLSCEELEQILSPHRMIR
jgi:aspartate ammonia-lyase